MTLGRFLAYVAAVLSYVFIQLGVIVANDMSLGSKLVMTGCLIALYVGIPAIYVIEAEQKKRKAER